MKISNDNLTGDKILPLLVRSITQKNTFSPMRMKLVVMLTMYMK